MNRIKERRRSRRIETVPNVAELEWWVGTEARQSSGRVLDVSRGGVQFEAAECGPPAGHSAWLHVGNEGPNPWVSAVVVWNDGPRAGLAFRDSCPEDVYLALTLGIDLSNLFL